METGRIIRAVASLAVLQGYAWGSFLRPAKALPWTGPGGASGSVPWNILVLLTLLTLLPALMLSMTPFVRLLVVFHFLRQALGTQSTPTNQTLIGLALVLSFFLMQPVMTAIHDSALVPYEQGKLDAMAAIEQGTPPLRAFMLKYVREKDLALFLELAKQSRPRRAEDLEMRVVVPAYILSELKAGFQIGAALYLPFLVVDMLYTVINMGTLTG
jgi:flagellar biosynthesis protein FliP